MSAITDITEQHNDSSGRHNGPGARTVFARAFTLGAVTVAAVGGVAALSVSGANAATHRPAAITQTKTAAKPKAPAARYQQGAWVAQLQRDLGQLNYYESPVDGVYGPQTTAAVEYFQRANGLTVDGIAGPATMAKINKQLITGDNQMNANLGQKRARKAPAARTANVSTGAAAGNASAGTGGAAIAPAATSGGAGLAPARS